MNKYQLREKEKHEKEPWFRILRTIKHRCENPNDKFFHRYGGRGIKCKLSVVDIQCLWFRDNGFQLKSPTIDRINNDGDYELTNCRFIENSENVRRALSKPILQFDIHNRFIQKWMSQNDAARILNISQGNIGSCCRGTRNKAGGFIWKFADGE